MKRLFAGAGKEEIKIPWNIFPYSEGPDTWTGIHDMPCVRVLVFENGSRWCLVSVEIVILEQDIVYKLKHILSRITGIPERNIWVSVTHTVTTPHFFGKDDPAWQIKRNIISAAADAAKTATECMKTASLGFGSGYCTVNTNRMIPTCDGWWIGNGEEYPSDHEVPVIRINDENGDPFIILYNYACELSVMDKSVMRDGGRHITADLSGAVSGIIEKAYSGKVTAVFIPGPSADQGPVYRARRVMRGRDGSYRTVDIRDDGWLLLQLAGERLAEQVIVTAEKISCDLKEVRASVIHDTFSFKGQKLRGLPNPLAAPSREWVSVPDDDRTRSVQIFTVNDDLAVIAAGGLSAATAMYIKEHSPYKNTIMMEHVSGSAPVLPTDGRKGMADAEAYDKGTIHARNSEFARGSAEKMKENILNMLQRSYQPFN